MTTDLETDLRAALHRDADLAPTLPTAWTGPSETRTEAPPSRRWLLGAAAAVVLVGLAGMLAITRNDATTVLPPAPTTLEPVITTIPSVSVSAPKSSVVPLGSRPPIALGSSVMLGAAEELAARGLLVDAAESRSSADILAEIESLTNDGQLGEAIVISNGVNGPVPPADVDRIMELLSNVERVVLVTVRVDREYADANNALLRALPARYPSVVIVDWAVEADNCVGDCFYADDIHLQADGRRLYADLVVEALGDNHQSPAIRVDREEISARLPQVAPTEETTVAASLLLGGGYLGTFGTYPFSPLGAPGQIAACLSYETGRSVGASCPTDETVGLVLLLSLGGDSDGLAGGSHNVFAAMHSSEVKLEALGGACIITTVNTTDAGIAISACELGDFVGTFDIVFTTEADKFVVEQWVPDSAEFEDVEVAPIVELSNGVVATLRVPAIDLDTEVGSELGDEALRLRPGLFVDGPRIGETGVALIWGHRTAWGQEFRRLDELAVGDEIVATTAEGVFTFSVVSTDVVEPPAVIPTTEDPSLLLVANHPKWTDDQEIRVLALLVP